MEIRTVQKWTVVICSLETLGLGGERNISQVEYTDKKGEQRPCFSLNRDGMLQMLNSVDEDEKIITRINNTSATFLTEYGLYEVLMQSRKLKKCRRYYML